MYLDNQRRDVFGALSDPYRRQLLIGLLEHNPQDDQDNNPLNIFSESDTVADALEIQLIHIHLPKLEAEGFIEWDQEAGEISKGPNWHTIGPILQILHDHRDELPDDWL
jgi:hypothetical protein